MAASRAVVAAAGSATSEMRIESRTRLPVRLVGKIMLANDMRENNAFCLQRDRR